MIDLERRLDQVQPPDDPEARAVVAAVLAGDRDAFRSLIERESAGVVRACYRILGDIHEAEDAAQEAFVTAYRSLATWRGDGPFGAWLRQVAVRIALRQAGKRKLQARVATLDFGDEIEGPGGAREESSWRLIGASEDHARSVDPLHGALRTEQVASVRAAVASLDEPYRETVALRFFADLSLAEIAEASGRPVPTVKTHLRRGLERLRDRLEPVAVGE